MDRTLKIEILADTIRLFQIVDQKEYELANRSFKENEWNKMIEAFRSTFIQPKIWGFSEIDWWVAVDDRGRGNYSRNFYKIVVNYECGFKYKFKSWKDFNDIFGTFFDQQTKFEDFYRQMEKLHTLQSGDLDPAFECSQSEFDVS
tara:strand:- start:216 stop:650 length:435 start_codon:yes stop_codon:yes gene_type:complete